MGNSREDRLEELIGGVHGDINAILMVNAPMACGGDSVLEDLG